MDTKKGLRPKKDEDRSLPPFCRYNIIPLAVTSLTTGRPTDVSDSCSQGIFTRTAAGIHTEHSLSVAPHPITRPDPSISFVHMELS